MTKNPNNFYTYSHPLTPTQVTRAMTWKSMLVADGKFPKGVRVVYENGLLTAYGNDDLDTRMALMMLGDKLVRSGYYNVQ